MAESTVVNIKGLDRLEDALDDLAWSVRNPAGRRPLMEAFGMVLERRTSRSFRQETAPEMVPDIGSAAQAAGRKWRALAEGTKAARKEAGTAGKILDATHGLRQTIVTAISGDATSVTVGTSSPIAPFHAGGTDPYIITPTEKQALAFIGPGGAFIVVKRVRHPGLVARPFLGVNDADVTTMLSSTKQHLSEAMG